MDNYGITGRATVRWSSQHTQGPRSQNDVSAFQMVADRLPKRGRAEQRSTVECQRSVVHRFSAEWTLHGEGHYPPQNQFGVCAYVDELGMPVSAAPRKAVAIR